MTITELAKKFGITGLIQYEESDKAIRFIKDGVMYIYKKDTKETLKIKL